jgi:PAS domain S-box-containing protein
MKIETIDRTAMDREFFRSLAENSHDIIHKVGIDFKTIYINPRIKYYSGEEPFYFIGKNIFDFVPSDKKAYWQNLYTSLLNGHEIIETTYEIDTVVGERIFHIKMVPEFDLNGQVESFLCITRDITEIEKTLAVLKKSENIFKISTENLLQPFVILSPLYDDTGVIFDFKYEYINEAGIISNGIPAEKTLGKNILDLFPLHKSNGIFDRLKEVMKSGISWREQIQYKGVTAGGFLDGYFQMTAAKAEDKLIVSWIDLTNLINTQIKLEEALKQKDLLIKEVHHRVKNNLQIITSILNLQLNYINDHTLRETFKESQNRIKSIALVHEKLYKSNFLSFVNLRSYLHDLINNLLFSYNAGSISVEYKIEEITLSNEQIIILGIITTEVISAIIKHVFPPYTSNPKRVKVRFEKKENYFLYSFSHIGSPLSQQEYEEKNPFSYELLSALVAQLDGEILINPDNECNFIVSFTSN